MKDNKPTPQERLEHILAAIEQIKVFVLDMNEADFLTNKLTQGAVLYQFMIIGEAIRYIDYDILEKYPYPWYLPRSFRNFITHEYHKVKLERVYAAAFELDELKKIATKILKNEF